LESRDLGLFVGLFGNAVLPHISIERDRQPADHVRLELYRAIRSTAEGNTRRDV